MAKKRKARKTRRSKALTVPSASFLNTDVQRPIDAPLPNAVLGPLKSVEIEGNRTVYSYYKPSES